eukprot:7385160-Prymnesium_polylepis.2
MALQIFHQREHPVGLHLLVGKLPERAAARVAGSGGAGIVPRIGVHRVDAKLGDDDGQWVGHPVAIELEEAAPRKVASKVEVERPYADVTQCELVGRAVHQPHPAEHAASVVLRVGLHRGGQIGVGERSRARQAFVRNDRAELVDGAQQRGRVAAKLAAVDAIGLQVEHRVVIVACEEVPRAVQLVADHPHGDRRVEGRADLQPQPRLDGREVAQARERRLLCRADLEGGDDREAGRVREVEELGVAHRRLERVEADRVGAHALHQLDVAPEELVPLVGVVVAPWLRVARVGAEHTFRRIAHRCGRVRDAAHQEELAIEVELLRARPALQPRCGGVSHAIPRLVTRRGTIGRHDSFARVGEYVARLGGRADARVPLCLQRVVRGAGARREHVRGTRRAVGRVSATRAAWLGGDQPKVLLVDVTVRLDVQRFPPSIFGDGCAARRAQERVRRRRVGVGADLGHREADVIEGADALRAAKPHLVCWLDGTEPLVAPRAYHTAGDARAAREPSEGAGAMPVSTSDGVSASGGACERWQWARAVAVRTSASGGLSKGDAASGLWCSATRSVSAPRKGRGARAAPAAIVDAVGRFALERCDKRAEPHRLAWLVLRVRHVAGAELFVDVAFGVALCDDVCLEARHAHVEHHARLRGGGSGGVGAARGGGGGRRMLVTF